MSDALTPLRHAYGEEPPGAALAPGESGNAEHELLRQMRAALDTRPPPRPDASVVERVLARAAEASSRTEGPVADPALAPLAAALGLPTAGPAASAGAPSEAAALAQAAAALDRLPARRPDPSAVRAVLAAAASSTPSRRSPRPAADRTAADRTAARPSRPRALVGVWAGGAGLVLAALVAVFTLPTFSASGDAQDEAPTVAEVQAPRPVQREEPRAAREEPADERPPPPPSAAPSLTGAAAVSAFVPVNEAVASAAPPPQPRGADLESPPVVTQAVASTPPVEWNPDTDLRALAGRLDQLDQDVERLLGDQPAEVFGRPAAALSRTATDGIQAVRAGGAAARAVLRPDSSQAPR